MKRVSFEFLDTAAGFPRRPVQLVKFLHREQTRARSHSVLIPLIGTRIRHIGQYSSRIASRRDFKKSRPTLQAALPIQEVFYSGKLTLRY